MEKALAYFTLFLAILGGFILGMYVASYKFGLEVEPHRWFMTITFTLFFAVVAVEKIKKIKIIPGFPGFYLVD